MSRTLIKCVFVLRRKCVCALDENTVFFSLFLSLGSNKALIKMGLVYERQAIIIIIMRTITSIYLTNRIGFTLSTDFISPSMDGFRAPSTSSSRVVVVRAQKQKAPRFSPFFLSFFLPSSIHPSIHPSVARLQESGSPPPPPPFLGTQDPHSTLYLHYTLYTCIWQSYK